MVPPKTERFELRLDEELLDQIDAWRRKRDDVPTRAEAVRRLVEVGLAKDATFAPQFSDGEKMIMFMLVDLLKATPGRHETNVDFLVEALSGGHYWGLRWDLSGIFHDYADSPDQVREVANFLDMWMFIESGYKKLSEEDKKRVDAEAARFGQHLTFSGFDGNNEAEHIGIARFFIEQMGRWQGFKGRELNSHWPVLGTYRRMYATFEPMRSTLAGTELGADRIIKILTENVRPIRGA